jgi:hypothetical protein
MLHILGFHGTGQPAGAGQAAVAGTIGAAVGATTATSTTPFGFSTSTQANGVVTLLNACRADVAGLTTLVNQLRSDLVALGLIKGAA